MNIDTDLLLQQLSNMPDKHAQLRALDNNSRPDFVRFLFKSGIMVESFDLNKVEWQNI